jgi:ferredoxin
MPDVTVENFGTIPVETGKKLVLAIEDAGIEILHRCGGNARCTTCRVQVIAGTPPPIQELERERLDRERVERDPALGLDIRLSCQIRVDSDLTVRVINTRQSTGKEPGPRPED